MKTMPLMFLALINLSCVLPLYGMEKLVDLHNLVPEILVDIRYAGTNNFSRTPLYESQKDKAFLRYSAASKLGFVQSVLPPGIGLCIWNAYCPDSTNAQIWQGVCSADIDCIDIKDRIETRNTRGVSVDCTLIDLETNTPLEMPTDFDKWWLPEAHINSMNVSEEAKRNRDLLCKVMEHVGFIPEPSRWWHFDMIGWSRLHPIDVPFDLCTVRERSFAEHIIG